MGFITELNETNYNGFVESGVALVDIYAIWCGPCKQIAPILDEFSIDFQGRVAVGKLDATPNGDKVAELGIRNIPTILVYKDGEIVDRSVGMTTKEKLSELVEQYLN
jgi:thioredoxin 1